MQQEVAAPVPDCTHSSSRLPSDPNRDAHSSSQYRRAQEFRLDASVPEDQLRAHFAERAAKVTSDIRAWQQAATSTQQHGQDDGAQEEAPPALDLSVEEAEALIRAEERFVRAPRDATERHEALFNLARAYCAVGKGAEAERIVEEMHALGLEPRSGVYFWAVYGYAHGANVDVAAMMGVIERIGW